MPLQPRELYKIGRFHLDVSERLLTNGKGGRLPIPEKAFETLLVLVENPGRLVTKDELMGKIWPDSFVEENNLDKCIHAIRRALNEKPGEQKFIETVRGHGYRFVARVVRVDDIDATRGIHLFNSDSDIGGIPILGARESGPTKPAHERPGLRKIGLILVPALVIIAAWLLYFYLNNADEMPRSDKIRVAILPLKPIDSGSRSDIYEIGVADALINKVNSMHGVFARPVSSIRKYADASQDALAAGKEQQVDFVVDSNYQLAGETIRISWQVINVTSGQIEESQIFEDSSSGLFGKQDAVVAEIASKLAKRFLTTFRTTAAKRGTANEEAYRLYLQGMYLYDRRTAVDALKSVQKLSAAIELDPGNALAWAGKAHAHRSLGNFGGRLSPHDQYKLSMEAIGKALALDENLSDAYSARCENKFFYEYDYQGAERDCKRAIELDPNSYLAHEIYSRCLWTLRRFEDAIQEVKHSIDIEPTSLFSQRNYGISLFYARRYDEAVHQFRRVSDMDPNFVANYAWFVPALLVHGNKQEAFDEFIKWQTLMKIDASVLEDYRRAYQNDGWPGVGRIRVKHFDEDKIRSYFLEACLTAHTGNEAKTLEYLERALERREWGLPFLHTDPSLDGLRSDPRYEELSQRVK